jgi:hypothetical protein
MRESIVLRGLRKEPSMWRYLDMAFRQVDHLDSWEWFTVMIIMLGVGLYCMRGFGSRAGY